MVLSLMPVSRETCRIEIPFLRIRSRMVDHCATSRYMLWHPLVGPQIECRQGHHGLSALRRQPNGSGAPSVPGTPDPATPPAPRFYPRVTPEPPDSGTTPA